jgi:hypothetical protein
MNQPFSTDTPLHEIAAIFHEKTPAVEAPIISPKVFGPETDFAKTIAFLNNFNIVWEYKPAGTHSYKLTDGTEYRSLDTLQVEEGSCDAVGGYAGFFTNFIFDETGKFKKMEIWE